MFIVVSILFFHDRWFSVWILERRENLISTRAAAGEAVPPGGSGGQTQTPYYDDVVIQQSDQELELNENAAYGPLC